MSTLQVSNVHLESTANNRIEYAGSNTVNIYAGGTNVLSANSSLVNTSSVAISTNNLTVGTSLYAVSNGNVGIGTGSPSEKLTVAGDISADGIVTTTNTFTVGTSSYFVANGNVGIGNSSPSEKLTVAGHVVPSVSNSHDLGTSSLRWRNIYTNDLNLNNGIGDYTIVEGEDDLFLYNNKKGKVYKFALIEVDPSTAPKKVK